MAASMAALVVLPAVLVMVSSVVLVAFMAVSVASVSAAGVGKHV